MIENQIENFHSIRSINNNEIYEKLRPLNKLSNTFSEYQGHGDDTQIQSSKSAIPPMSSSSNEFSLGMAMRITDTSNEALKTDDENGMTKPYFISKYYQKEKEIILSDVSLQQQSPINECEYEIDLGNGYITKSISSYQKQQQRTASILSADSSQPITTFKIPFTNTIYKPQFNPKVEIRTNSPNALVHSQQIWSKFSFKTVTVFSIGTAVIIFLIVIMFFVF